jgi:rod shape-determining protein MreC
VKRLFTKYGVMLLSLAVLIAVLLSIMVYFSSTSAALPNVAGVIASPFRAAASAVTETVGGWVDYFTEFDALKEENQRLQQELAEKDELIRQAEADRDENERLRELLNLREQRRDLSFESARVVETDASNWSALLTINKGTAQDIAVGDCVVTASGYLVGEITEAGLNWSTVRTVIDSDTSIGAMVFRSGLTAVAQGDFSLMSQERLQLGYLGAQGDVMTGDLIVTSGLGGYNPAQIVIGYVEEVSTGDDGLSQYAVIRPEADLNSLSQVFVITDFTLVD